MYTHSFVNSRHIKRCYNYCRLHYLPAKTHPHDFTDATYQTQLPPYARSTAAQVTQITLMEFDKSEWPLFSSVHSDQLGYDRTNHRARQKFVQDEGEKERLGEIDGGGGGEWKTNEKRIVYPSFKHPSIHCCTRLRLSLMCTLTSGDTRRKSSQVRMMQEGIMSTWVYFIGRFGLKKSKKKVATSEDTTTANTIIGAFLTFSWQRFDRELSFGPTFFPPI